MFVADCTHNHGTVSSQRIGRRQVRFYLTSKLIKSFIHAGPRLRSTKDDPHVSKTPKASAPCSAHSRSCYRSFVSAHSIMSVRIHSMRASQRTAYDLGFSFFSFHSADRPTPDTLTTLKRTPGISPLALPLRPKPARRTSSFSSTKLRQPSLGTARVSDHFSIAPFVIHWVGSYVPKAVTFLPFLINCTLTHFRMAELGCLASTPTFSSTMPLACEEPPKGDDLYMVPRRRFL
jgi:hypothetical protein